VLDALGAGFDGRTCQLRGVAGNNHIVFALAGSGGRAERLRRRLARDGALLPIPGRGLVNRLCVRLLLIYLAWRSVLH
jgi:spermidine synthase